MTVTMRVIQERLMGKTLIFKAGTYYFGRGAECHVRPNSEWLSRQHCLLRVTAGAAYLRDLESRNGTLVNGALLSQERRLGHGDQVQIGPLVFEIHLEKEDAAPAAVEAFSFDALGAPSEPDAVLESTAHLSALRKDL